MTERKSYPPTDRQFRDFFVRAPRSARWVCKVRGHDWRSTFIGTMCERCDTFPKDPKGKAV